MIGPSARFGGATRRLRTRLHQNHALTANHKSLAVQSRICRPHISPLSSYGSSSLQQDSEGHPSLTHTLRSLRLLLAHCELIVSNSPPRHSNELTSLLRPLVKTALQAGALYLPSCHTGADGRRALSADRRHAFANQTAPPTPSDATTPALLPSRNQPTRRLSASCWQDVTRMKRWCRLSALQAKQALGHVHTWHRGTSASASATAVYLCPPHCQRLRACAHLASVLPWSRGRPTTC